MAKARAFKINTKEKRASAGSKSNITCSMRY